MRALLFIAAVVLLVASCGGPPPYECGTAAPGEDNGCVFGPSCPRGTLTTAVLYTDADGFPFFACTDDRGRAVVDCVLRDEGGAATGICRAGGGQ